MNKFVNKLVNTSVIVRGILPSDIPLVQSSIIIGTILLMKLLDLGASAALTIVESRVVIFGGNITNDDVSILKSCTTTFLS